MPGYYPDSVTSASFRIFLYSSFNNHPPEGVIKWILLARARARVHIHTHTRTHTQLTEQLKFVFCSKKFLGRILKSINPTPCFSSLQISHLESCSSCRSKFHAFHSRSNTQISSSSVSNSYHGGTHLNYSSRHRMKVRSMRVFMSLLGFLISEWCLEICCECYLCYSLKFTEHIHIPYNLTQIMHLYDVVK
jgi:hypothetical protein